MKLTPSVVAAAIVGAAHAPGIHGPVAVARALPSSPQTPEPRDAKLHRYPFFLGLV